MPSQICLIDAKNFLYRNHYTHRDLHGPEGEPTGVLYGCINGMLSLQKRLPDTPLVMVWDGEGETWRHRFLSGHQRQEKPQSKTGSDWVGKQIAQSIRYITRPQSMDAGKEKLEGRSAAKDKPIGYKAHRVDVYGSEQQADRNVALSQIPELKRILRVMGLRNFKIGGLEGDDLIGLLATTIIKRQLFQQVIIHSSDTDFYQLLTNDIRILKGIDQNGELAWAYPIDIETKYGVHVCDWTKYRALTGDKSDNIPQLLHKVGPVRAKQLLRSGVDASKGRHEVSRQAINALMDMTKGDLDLEDFWQRLRKNYIACQIMTCDNYSVPMNNEVVHSKVKELVATTSRESLLRDDLGKGENAYREFCEWCMGHGMGDLRAKATDFQGFV